MLPGEGVTLCEEQRVAVEKILSSSKPVTVLTGEAGSGKSTVVNELRHRVPCLMCATTGKSAMLVEGCTVDQAFAIDRTSWRCWSSGYQEFVMRQCPDLIIIDESSAAGKKMGNLIAEAREAFKKKILLVGDWAQTRPVKDDWLIYSKLLHDYDFICLRENHRQNEADYMKALRSIRVGEVTKQAAELFSGRVMATPPDDDTFIRIYGTNKKTDAYNNARLFHHVHANQLGFVRLFASFRDLRHQSKQTSSPRDNAFIANAIDSSRMAHGEPVAIGCRVVCTVNATSAFGEMFESSDRAYVNGDSGTLVGGLTEDGRQLEEALRGFQDGGKQFRVHQLDVLLDRTGKVVQIPRTTKVAKDPLNTPTHEVVGWPVRLGYASTCHRMQGATVQKAWVDLPSFMAFPDAASRHGLVYVALSRTRTLGGLYISAWCPQAVHCDPEIMPLLRSTFTPSSDDDKHPDAVDLEEGNLELTIEQGDDIVI